MKSILTKITHILIILIIGGIEVQTIISCSGGDDDGGGGGSCGTVKIGAQTWQKCNMNVEPSIGESKCYGDKPENCDKYGRLYDWEAAKSVCPSGWHLPSKEEWDALTVYIEDDKGCTGCAAEHLKAKSGWSDKPDGPQGNGLDSYGFAALPGGGGSSDGGNVFAEAFGYWWSSTPYNGNDIYIRVMIYVYEYTSWFPQDKSLLFSVRCLKD